MLVLRSVLGELLVRAATSHRRPPSFTTSGEGGVDSAAQGARIVDLVHPQ